MKTDDASAIGAASIARSEDGGEIPFEWVYPGAEAYEWVRDREHWVAPMPPMELWLHKHWPHGLDRAWAEMAMEPPPTFYRFQYVGPFLYARETMPEPAQMIRMALRYRQVSQEHGGPLALWQNVCRPRIEAACRDLSEMDGNAALAQIADIWAYGFHQTFTCLAPMFETGMQLTALLAHDSSDGTLESQEVVQGGENATQAIDREIWKLAEVARTTPAVKTMLERATDSDALAALRREPACGAFVSAFDALIDRHGSRSQGWELSLPTWRERPEAALSLIRARLLSRGPSPAEVAASSEQLRREARDRALSRLPAEKHAEFLELLTQGEGYVSIREGRAYWQMVLCGEVRGVLLRIGDRLAAEGRLDRAEDVFFLEPRDVEGKEARDLRTIVQERRREWERWRDVVPPEKIGTPTTPATAPPETKVGELRGSAASRGVATGPARIVHKPEESSLLQPGEIMVCVMTTPAWTPMFGIASAIVTETGGPLSHPAITAREYGIPAVVAVKDATSRIRDGQVVTVDGAAGIVSLT